AELAFADLVNVRLCLLDILDLADSDLDVAAHDPDLLTKLDSAFFHSAAKHVRMALDAEVTKDLGPSGHHLFLTLRRAVLKSGVEPLGQFVDDAESVDLNP